jgi:hypothetical protein
MFAAQQQTTARMMMLFLDFDHVPDDALLTKAEVAAWRRTSVDTVEKDVRARRLVQVQMSPRRVGITAGSVRALNRLQASDAVRFPHHD